MPRARRKDAPRHPCGKINRNALARVDDPRNPIIERRARRWGMPVNEVTRPWLLDPRHDSALGELSLRGERSPIAGIDEDQHEAGKFIQRHCAAYHRLVLGRTAHPAAPSLEMIPEQVTSADDDGATARAFESIEDRIRRITERYAAILQALDGAGGGVRKEVLAVCVEDRTCGDLDLVKRGLDAVFRDFGLG